MPKAERGEISSGKGGSGKIFELSTPLRAF